jgi:hypothetical protein
MFNRNLTVQKLIRCPLSPFIGGNLDTLCGEWIDEQSALDSLALQTRLARPFAEIRVVAGTFSRPKGAMDSARGCVVTTDQSS